MNGSSAGNRKRSRKRRIESGGGGKAQRKQSNLSPLRMAANTECTEMRRSKLKWSSPSERPSGSISARCEIARAGAAPTRTRRSGPMSPYRCRRFRVQWRRRRDRIACSLWIRMSRSNCPDSPPTAPPRSWMSTMRRVRDPFIWRKQSRPLCVSSFGPLCQSAAGGPLANGIECSRRLIGTRNIATRRRKTSPTRQRMSYLDPIMLLLLRLSYRSLLYLLPCCCIRCRCLQKKRRRQTTMYEEE